MVGNRPPIPKPETKRKSNCPYAVTIEEEACLSSHYHGNDEKLPPSYPVCKRAIKDSVPARPALKI
jgi:hypothetical protein